MDAGGDLPPWVESTGQNQRLSSGLYWPIMSTNSPPVYVGEGPRSLGRLPGSSEIPFLVGPYRFSNLEYSFFSLGYSFVLTPKHFFLSNFLDHTLFQRSFFLED